MRFSWLGFLSTVNKSTLFFKCSRELSKSFIHEPWLRCSFSLFIASEARYYRLLPTLAHLAWQRSPTVECATSPPLKWFSKREKGMQSWQSVPCAARRTEKPNQMSREAMAPRSIQPESIWAKWTRYIHFVELGLLLQQKLGHSLTCDERHDVHVWLERHGWTGPSLTGPGAADNPPFYFGVTQSLFDLWKSAGRFCGLTHVVSVNTADFFQTSLALLSPLWISEVHSFLA